MNLLPEEYPSQSFAVSLREIHGVNFNKHFVPTDSYINELIAADSITFTKFLTAVAARTGEILNYSNIAGEVGVSTPTIKNWISILERTGIVYLMLA